MREGAVLIQYFLWSSTSLLLNILILLIHFTLTISEAYFNKEYYSPVFTWQHTYFRSYSMY